MLKFFGLGGSINAAVASAIRAKAEADGVIAADVPKTSDSASRSTPQLPLPHVPTEDDDEIAADVLKLSDLSESGALEIEEPRRTSTRRRKDKRPSYRYR